MGWNDWDDWHDRNNDGEAFAESDDAQAEWDDFHTWDEYSRSRDEDGLSFDDHYMPTSARGALIPED